MTAKRTAFQPLSSSRIPAERKGAAERVPNPECCDFPPQEPEKAAASASGVPAVGAVGGSGPVVDESSDSEGEQEGPQKLIRKVSTSGQIRSKTSVKEGLLLKQTSSFQRWKKRYFKLRGRTLYYAKDAKSLIFDEVDLSDASVAESSTKNINNSFTVRGHFQECCKYPQYTANIKRVHYKCNINYKTTRFYKITLFS
nr:diacylglycerol kinase eta isoform X8 [Danio rerio]XP_021330300.1 diacylglycerol kinase eta isoform X11 [Danio rerio]|eukprot:XP_021327824.1 diacylglycerol kinase eta isoform X8 [Danio rerio]